MDFPRCSELDSFRKQRALVDLLVRRGRLPLGVSEPLRKGLSLRSWPRLWASFESLRFAWLALKRAGIVRDIRNLIFFNYLHCFYFHMETNTLILERIQLKQEFQDFARQKHLMSCVRHGARFLRLECGELWPHNSRFIQSAHSCSFHLSPCVHDGTWCRVHLSPEKKVSKKKDDVEQHQNILEKG